MLASTGQSAFLLSLIASFSNGIRSKDLVSRNVVNNAAYDIVMALASVVKKLGLGQLWDQPVKMGRVR